MCDLLLDVLALALCVSLVQVVLLRQSRDALLRKILEIGLHNLYGTNLSQIMLVKFTRTSKEILLHLLTGTFGCFGGKKMSTNIMKS